VRYHRSESVITLRESKNDSPCALFRRDRIDISFVLRVLLAQAASVELIQPFVS